MIQSQSRRKLSNLIVDPKTFARLSIPFILLAVVNLGIVYAIKWQVLHALENTELHGTENLQTMNALLEVQQSVTRTGVIGLVIVGFLCLALWVIFSHRIFGPIVPLRRHVQNLARGEYRSRIKPRPRDEFKELFEDLNHLAEVLESKSK